jgi:hypothetical protein
LPFEKFSFSENFNPSGLNVRVSHVNSIPRKFGEIADAKLKILGHSSVGMRPEA